MTSTTRWNGRIKSGMSGRKVLLDSNILIYLSKGTLEIEAVFNAYDEFYISIITYMEVMGFKFDDEKELAVVKALLDNFHMININPEIAEIVIAIRQKKRIKLPDAIILASAIFLKCHLLTKNVNDFQGIEECVMIVDPSGGGLPKASNTQKKKY